MNADYLNLPTSGHFLVDIDGVETMVDVFVERHQSLDRIQIACSIKTPDRMRMTIVQEFPASDLHGSDDAKLAMGSRVNETIRRLESEYRKEYGKRGAK